MARIGETQKHFQQFSLSNAMITELKANTFRDLTFDKIVIEDCLRLEKIDVMAFNGTDRVTKMLAIRDNPRLSSPNNSIYRVLNKFVNIEIIKLERNNINEIPDYAFSRQLTKLSILGFASMRFNKLGDFAFATLPKLNFLDFDNVEFDIIHEQAFVFGQVSTMNLNINFKNIKTRARSGKSVFKYGSLANINRTTDITFEGQSFLTLNWIDIGDYLKANEKSTIDLGGCYIACDKCLVLFESGLSTVKDRIKNLKCLPFEQNTILGFSHDDKFRKCVL